MREITHLLPYLLVSLGVVVGGIFITLAAFQVLPQGVNAISQLGALGKGS